MTALDARREPDADAARVPRLHPQVDSSFTGDRPPSTRCRVSSDQPPAVHQMVVTLTKKGLITREPASPDRSGSSQDRARPPCPMTWRTTIGN